MHLQILESISTSTSASAEGPELYYPAHFLVLPTQYGYLKSNIAALTTLAHLK